MNDIVWMDIDVSLKYEVPTGFLCNERKEDDCDCSAMKFESEKYTSCIIFQNYLKKLDDTDFFMKCEECLKATAKSRLATKKYNGDSNE